MSLLSDKYKKRLLPIKQELMKEIASYFDYGKFEMRKETIISYEVTLSTFEACFDTIRGYDTYFKLYMKDRDFMTVIGFDASDDSNVDKDIPFLMKLLDYVDMDYRNNNYGKRPVV